MSNDAMLAMAVWITAIALSVAVVLYRHALTRVEPRNAADNGGHTGLSRSALQFLMRKHPETAFALLAVKVALDAVAVAALTVYLLAQAPASWVFVPSLLGAPALPCFCRWPSTRC